MIGTSLLFSGSIGGLLTPFDSVAPTAGYSLRNLGLSYSGAVVRVRKDITGNPEQDFTAGQITNGTLSDFLETLGTDAHSQSVSTQFEDLSDVSLICDCNSGGTDELDAFDALYENGFVSKWYDQFGSNDAEQTTAAEQPKIWDSVTGLVTENGKPAIDFDGVDDRLITSSFASTLAQPSTTFIVNNAPNNTSDNTLIDGIIVSNRHLLIANANNYTLNAGAFVNTGANSDAQSLLYTLWNGASSEFASDGGTPNIINIGTHGLTGLTIGANFVSSNANDGNVQEIILYNSDQSANRTDIENNINDYYDIY